MVEFAPKCAKYVWKCTNFSKETHVSFILKRVLDFSGTLMYNLLRK